MRSGTELSQFLRVFLPTLSFYAQLMFLIFWPVSYFMPVCISH